MLRAAQLLAYLSQAYNHERLLFSREEIGKKINQLKYLSAQKKVPKLTLRREILHLEDMLKDIATFEKRLLTQRKRESAKVLALRKQNEALRRRIAASSEKDLHKKVEKLSHLLAEAMAMKSSAKDIGVQTIAAQTPRSQVQQHLERIKQQIAKHPDHPKSLLLQEKIGELERQLNPQIPVKHDILFKAGERQQDAAL